MRERAALLFLILCFAAALKVAFRPGIGRNSLDGNYYYQVARSVAEGRGLETHVSLYHQGLRQLPHPTNVYPVWPLVLGTAARALSLPAAAATLPPLLYLLDLLLLYLLAQRIDRRLRGPDRAGDLLGGGILTPAHAAVLIFGFNPVFFNFTSLPYTEALAFAFGLSALLALDRAVDGRPLLWGGVAGTLAALAFLTRSQMVGVGLAVVAALAIVGWRERRYLAAAGVVAGTAALLVAPWVVYLASWMSPFRPRAMLFIGAYREMPEIPGFQWVHKVDGTADLVADRIGGVIAAFDPWSPYSYVESFGLAAWLVPLAGLVLLARLPRFRESARSMVRPERMVAVAAVVAAAIQLLPLQWRHARYLSEWRFAHRHGLPLILVLVVVVPWLLDQRKRWLRWLTLALVAASVISGTFRTVNLLRVDFPSGLLGAEPELVRWLDSRPERPTVITTNAQTLAAFSHAGFHWMECRESSRKTQALMEGAGVDYLIVYNGEASCPWVEGLDGLPVVAAFGEGGYRIEVRATAPQP